MRTKRLCWHLWLFAAGVILLVGCGGRVNNPGLEAASRVNASPASSSPATQPAVICLGLYATPDTPGGCPAGLTSTNLPDFYASGKILAGGITVSGSGFTSDTTLALNPASLFAGSVFVNATTMNLTIQQCNTNCDYGVVQITASNSNGTSNSLFMMFPSIAATGDCSVQINVSDPLECYVLDPFNSKIYAYSQSTGALLRTLSIGSGSQALAFDPVSKQLIYTTHGGGGLNVLNADGSAGGGVSFISPGGMFAPAAAGGFGSVSRPGASGFIYFTMGGVVNSFNSVTISPSGSQPGPIAMTTLSGQVVTAIYDTEQNQLAIVNIPQGTVRGQQTVVGLRKASTLSIGEGGWYMGYIGSTLALVSRPDNVIVFFDGSTGLESRRVTLSGKAISLSTSNGKAEVGIEDLAAGKTALIQVDPATGSITHLTTTAPFGATMMKVSPAGTTVFSGNRTSFQKAGNN